MNNVEGHDGKMKDVDQFKENATNSKAAEDFAQWFYGGSRNTAMIQEIERLLDEEE